MPPATTNRNEGGDGPRGAAVLPMGKANRDAAATITVGEAAGIVRVTVLVPSRANQVATAEVPIRKATKRSENQTEAELRLQTSPDRKNRVEQVTPTVGVVRLGRSRFRTA